MHERPRMENKLNGLHMYICISIMIGSGHVYKYTVIQCIIVVRMSEDHSMYMLIYRVHSTHPKHQRGPVVCLSDQSELDSESVPEQK